MDRLKTYEKWKAKRLPMIKEVYGSDDLTFVPASHCVCIGGSSDAALLGIGKWQTKQDVYNTLTQKPKPDETNFLFYLGHYMETFVGGMFSEVTGFKTTLGDTIIFSKRPWSIAQIDAFALENGKEVPLEIKTSNVNPTTDDGSKYWGKGCVFNEKHELLKADDLIPPQYYVQVQKQIWACGTDHAWLAVWLRFEDKIRVFRIQRNEEIIEKIREAEDDMIFNHIIPGIPYPDETPRVELIEEDADTLKCSEELRKLYEDYKDANQKKNEFAKIEKELGEKIKNSVGTHTRIIDDGGLVFKMASTTRRVFDSKRFKEEHGDLYAQYLIEQKSAPRII